ncbi:Glutathione S-transferase 1-1 [Trachymyrmex zeteki]|uniref:Glutathione S-transferase 1-1 n=1 Tax=Mycetomoellerius zeteki TaxID=64791 RepID=A0A151XC42_9HYME|nr:Glutathione S-transferase 1-1 [Trachymyrmex zeteki]
MPIDLYQLTGSPPCRAVLLTAAALEVDLNLKKVDLSIGEHLKPEFIKMNPQHTVPTLDDNGLYLGESRAIMIYLANQYGKKDSLYPKDPKKRALVDQRLFFDLGTLYKSFSDHYYPIMLAGATPQQATYDKMNEALTFLDKFLEGENYVAGKTLTLADLALVVTVSNFKLMDYDLSKYSNILRWYAKIKAEAPKYNEIESVGMKAISCVSADSKMPIDLYQLTGSPPCRAVLLPAPAVGVDLNVKNVDLSAGEHLKPEFIKMNPQHTVPTLDDDGLYLCESRAIMTYLVNQYGKNDSLYPNDPKKRAMVDQRLYFDMGTLYRSFANYYYPIIFTGVTPAQAKYDKLHEALSFLNKFLEGENYVAGKTLTLADITLVVTVSNFPLMDYDLSKYSNILRWFIKIQAEIPNYSELESIGMKTFADFVEHYKKKT